jgi:hypothetical protein
MYIKKIDITFICKYVRVFDACVKINIFNHHHHAYSNLYNFIIIIIILEKLFNFYLKK